MSRVNQRLFEKEIRRESARIGWTRDAGRLFAKRIRAVRLDSEHTQGTVAILMASIYGHSTWKQTTMAKVESGEREVKLTEAIALADILAESLVNLIRPEEGSDGDD